MKIPLAIAAVAEGATGLALLVAPTLVVRLLLGAEITGAGIATSRVAGLALIALAIACLPGVVNGALKGMLTYSLLVTIYLGWLGLARGATGKLLWPAVIAHVILTALLARACFQSTKNANSSRDIAGDP